MTTVVLGARHGTVHNPDGVIYAGLPGFGLSDAGREQAAALAEGLGPIGLTAVYASPLQRAVETATPLADACGLDVVTDERLSEWKHWHQWAGMTWEELQEKGREAWEAYRSHPGSVTSGESLDELADRVQSWMEDAAKAHPEGVVLAVSHLEPLRAMLLRETGRPTSDLFALEVDQGQVVRLSPDADAVPVAPSQVGGLLDGS